MHFLVIVEWFSHAYSISLLSGSEESFTLVHKISRAHIHFGPEFWRSISTTAAAAKQRKQGELKQLMKAIVQACSRGFSVSKPETYCNELSSQT